jgi:ABC-type multidrug transport system fused ATPase/permease subunit
MLWTIPLYKRAQARLDRVLGLTRENLTGVRVIRAFRKEEGETKEFGARNEELTRVQKRVGRISALMNPLTYVIINVAIAYLVWVGALRVEAGVLTQGAVVALYNYMSQILVELVKLASLIITITKAVACGNRIQAALEIRSSLAAPEKEPEQAGEFAVEFKGAALRYRGAGGSAVSGIDLKVRRGEIVGVIGGTGSGKTSLVSLIPRFYDTAEGQVLVNGADVRDYPLDALRLKIGFVPQKASLFKGTIRENLLWGKPGATDAELLSAVKVAQAEDVVKEKGGLDGFIEQRGRNLSGGQAQRLTIARALARGPEILILDDSASALDFATDAALRKAIRALDPRPTVFVVSQRASSVRFADQIVVLDDGKIAGIGKSDELYETCAVYREIYDSQYRKEGAHEGE